MEITTTKTPKINNGVAALLISVAILVLGNNLQGTLLGIRAGVEGISKFNIGLMMSSYYVGFILGSVTLAKLLVLVGHIRTYAALASFASALTLSYILLISPSFWIVLRFLQGFSYAGMILVIESWLNGCAEKKNRGSLLAKYGLVFWGCSAISQTFLNLAAPESFILFCFISIMVSLALVPVTVAPSRAPLALSSNRYKLRKLLKVSPVGMFAVFVSGLCMGSVWGMAPVFGQRIELSTSGISFFMFSLMAGTLISQWPLGKISDKTDRRLVIVITSFIAGSVSIFLSVQNNPSVPLLLTLALIYGALAFPLYSIAVAHVNDCIHQEENIGVAGTLILLQGIGSAIGPMASGALMEITGPGGMFMFVGSSLVALAVFGILVIPQRKAISHKLKQNFMAVPRTSYVFLYQQTRRKGEKRLKKWNAKQHQADNCIDLNLSGCKYLAVNICIQKLAKKGKICYFTLFE
ncbi:Transporter, Major facilitator superfamily [Chitinispirillum alkaliphilum]|nr:Transporter, Major facilitator superfamily [Chitinispirillum alkaliphilum]